MTTKNATSIGYELEQNGFRLTALNTNHLGVSFPPGIFSKLSPQAQAALAENFTYARTRQLSLLLQQPIKYQFSQPVLRSFIDQAIQLDLPRIAAANAVATKKLTARFKQSQPAFQPGKAKKMLRSNQPAQNRAVLAMSFGKDSLLSYGLLRELGLRCHLVFVRELEHRYDVEAGFKQRIIEQFIKREHVHIDTLIDNADDIFVSKKITTRLKEFENTNGMAAFTLELLPYLYRYGAKYLVVGNEANLNDWFYNNDKIKTHPSTDQTSAYTVKQNRYLATLTNRSAQVVSLVEPIYNLAEVHILYHRYPDLLPYLMSCEPKTASTDRWCYRCPMCAKIFLYTAAVGGDLKKIGFNKTLLEQRHRSLYPVFSKTITRAYEKPPAVIAEQRLALLLAERNGWRGPLIERFKVTQLAATKRNERTLRRKFFGLHTTATIPSGLKTKLMSIYRQELTPWL